MNPIPRKMEKTDQDLINEYLEKGGEIKRGKPGAISEDVVTTGGFYGRRKKPGEASDASE